MSVSAREIFARLGLVFFGLAAGLICAEIAARMLYTRPWHEQLVAAQLTSPVPDSLIATNRWGLRDVDYPSPKPPNTRRILFLGDSFTFGAGLGDDAAVFPAVVEARLAEEYRSTGTSIEVLNGGIPGSMTDEWVTLLEEIKGSFQPDVIVIVFFLRDGTSTSSMGAFFGPIRDRIVERNQTSRLYQASYLYRVFRDTRDRNLISTRYSQEINESYSGTETQTREWVLAQANLLEIQAQGAALGAKVGLVIFPILADLESPGSYPFESVTDVLTRFGNDHDLPTLNLLGAFRGHSGPELWVAPTNQHPNAAGHLIAAEALMPYLRELLGF